jgi:hypothetical protein
MDEGYAREGRGWVFPSAMPPYGFTTWLNPIDPVRLSAHTAPCTQQPPKR